jgi:hypothetical protein
MKGITRLFWISIGLAAGAPALGYALIGYTQVALLLLAFGGLWIICQLRRLNRFHSILMACLVLMAAGGIYAGVSPFLALVGVLAGLAAWDLAFFIQQLWIESETSRTTRLIQTHLRRLVIVIGLGAILAGIALYSQVHLRFGVVFFLGLLAMLGLGQLLGYLRQESD